MIRDIQVGREDKTKGMTIIPVTPGFTLVTHCSEAEKEA